MEGRDNKTWIFGGFTPHWPMAPMRRGPATDATRVAESSKFRRSFILSFFPSSFDRAHVAPRRRKLFGIGIEESLSHSSVAVCVAIYRYVSYSPSARAQTDGVACSFC